MILAPQILKAARFAGTKLEQSADRQASRIDGGYESFGIFTGWYERNKIEQSVNAQDVFGACKTPVSADEEWMGLSTDVGHLLVFGVLGNQDWRPIIDVDAVLSHTSRTPTKMPILNKR